MKFFVVLCISLFCWAVDAGEICYILLRGCGIRDLNIFHSQEHTKSKFKKSLK